MNDDFRIRVGRKGMAFGDQLILQLEIVVYLAIKDRPNAAVFVTKRLLAAFNIDDAQPAMRQADQVTKIKPLAVRTAMGHDASHSAQALTMRVGERGFQEDAGYTAHKRVSSEVSVVSG